MNPVIVAALIGLAGMIGAAILNRALDGPLGDRLFGPKETDSQGETPAPSHGNKTQKQFIRVGVSAVVIGLAMFAVAPEIAALREYIFPTEQPVAMQERNDYPRSIVLSPRFAAARVVFPKDGIIRLTARTPTSGVWVRQHVKLSGPTTGCEIKTSAGRQQADPAKRAIDTRGECETEVNGGDPYTVRSETDDRGGAIGHTFVEWEYVVPSS